MNKTREINIKPSCMNEIHGFPTDQTSQLWEKINFLVKDPFPAGKLKKKLKTKKNLYRLRVGAFRMFYTFGDTWVRLLGIRSRKDKDIYKLESMTADKPVAPNELEENDLDELLAAQGSRRQFDFKADSTETLLPRKITKEWLLELKIPPGYIPALLSCGTEESLLGVQIPSPVIERVVDNLYPKPIEEVENQPDFVIQDTGDLVRYKEGDLVTFLLRLDDDQYRLTNWALNGPTMVKGGAGTGKSTVALYRVRDYFTRPESTGEEHVLFTTYTRALVNASQQLLGQLLPPDQLERVRVATCDAIARKIVSANRTVGNLDAGTSTEAVFRSARSEFLPSGSSGFEKKLRAKALEKYSDRYLLEEFEWIIEGRMLKSLEEYLKAPRPGRGHGFNAKLRKTVWELHLFFISKLKETGIERFSDLRQEALELVRSGRWTKRFDYVLVDEAQDLTPVALSLMAEIAESEKGIFFASDSKQSIYSRNYTWEMVHPRLKFKGRTAILKRNYRSTREIDRAAFDILKAEEDEVLEPSLCVQSGPLPVMIKNVPVDKEATWAARFIRQFCKHFHLKFSTASVLVPTKYAGERIAIEIAENGVPARYVTGTDLDLHANTTKVMTLHSSKGLEFPVVVVCGLNPGRFLFKTNNDSQETLEEKLRQDRRLLYVGMTRAMRGLMLLYNEECKHDAILGLDPGNWYVENLS